MVLPVDQAELTMTFKTVAGIMADISQRCRCHFEWYSKPDGPDMQPIIPAMQLFRYSFAPAGLQAKVEELLLD
jgi:hypothetical protein